MYKNNHKLKILYKYIRLTGKRKQLDNTFIIVLGGRATVYVSKKAPPPPPPPPPHAHKI